MKHPGGRPTTYSQETADAIVEHLSNGGSLNEFCKPEDRPSRATVYLWVNRNKEFAEKYHNAQRNRAHALWDQMIDVAGDESRDVPRARLMTDVMRIYAERIYPDVYQPSQRVQAAGEVQVTAPEWIEKKDEQ